MDYKNSACAQKRKVKGLGKGLRRETITAGNNRAACRSKQAASKKNRKLLAAVLQKTTFS
jgi:hypothetical protein